MIVLEFVGRDAGSDALLFRDGDGREFVAPLTEMLTSSILRGSTLEVVPDSPQRRLTPREIQALLREGLTAIQINEQTGTDIERVRRFEGPVRAEIMRAIDRALSSPVGNEPDSPTIGDLVVDRLAERGVDTEELRWTASKRDSGAWEVSVVFVEDDIEKSAMWTLAEATDLATASDDTARELTETTRTPETVRALFPPVASSTVDPFSDEDDILLERQEQLLKRLSAARGRRQPVMMGFEGEDEQVETVPIISPVVAPPSPAPAALGHVDQVEPEERSASSTNANTPPDRDPNEGEDASPKPTESSKKRGRKPMPSWDEIVFGSRGN
ncbi:septation protein SepH [Actinomyces minihominis]|uniref:septation protein SepH n=1 Tax=Actinomyces minihominis TaxID=2002838 RepID=UPI000C087F09|nr:septation protein SepH [Actinomyces minihominis]